MKQRKDHLGLYLFDRTTGLNCLLDEVSFPQEEWHVAPRYVSIALTNACELKCQYCYASKKPERLTIFEVLGWCEELAKLGCLGVGFGGGEPTLHPDFVDICRQAHTRTDLAVTFTTHGHRLTNELCDKLAGHVDAIRLSMDGVGPTYEKLRGRQFDQFVKKAEIAKQAAKIAFNFVVNEDTVGDLDSAAEMTLKHGAFQLLLLPELRSDGKPNLSDGAIETLSLWVAANYARLPVACSAEGACLLQDSPFLPVTGYPDNLDQEFMHIDASGMLKLNAFSKSGVALQSRSIDEAIHLLRNERISQ